MMGSWVNLRCSGSRQVRIAGDWLRNLIFFDATLVGSRNMIIRFVKTWKPAYDLGVSVGGSSMLWQVYICSRWVLHVLDCRVMMHFTDQVHVLKVDEDLHTPWQGLFLGVVRVRENMMVLLFSSELRSLCSWLWTPFLNLTLSMVSEDSTPRRLPVKIRCGDSRGGNHGISHLESAKAQRELLSILRSQVTRQRRKAFGSKKMSIGHLCKLTISLFLQLRKTWNLIHLHRSRPWA